MTQHYTNPSRADQPRTLPDCETFHWGPEDFIGADEDSYVGHYMREALGCEQNEADPSEIEEAAKDLTGWYVWACFPGCMPDSDPWGPYKTEEEALEGWREQCGVYDHDETEE